MPRRVTEPTPRDVAVFHRGTPEFEFELAQRRDAGNSAGAAELERKGWVKVRPLDTGAREGVVESAPFEAATPQLWGRRAKAQRLHYGTPEFSDEITMLYRADASQEAERAEAVGYVDTYSPPRGLGRWLESVVRLGAGDPTKVGPRATEGSTVMFEQPTIIVTRKAASTSEQQ